MIKKFLLQNTIVKDVKSIGGTKPSDFPRNKALPMSTLNGDDLILCDTVLPNTPSGKIELFSRDLEDRFGYGLPRCERVERQYPLSIISPASSKRTNAIKKRY